MIDLEDYMKNKQVRKQNAQKIDAGICLKRTGKT